MRRTLLIHFGKLYIIYYILFTTFIISFRLLSNNINYFVFCWIKSLWLSCQNCFLGINNLRFIHSIGNVCAKECLMLMRFTFYEKMRNQFLVSNNCNNCNNNLITNAYIFLLSNKLCLLTYNRIFDIFLFSFCCDNNNDYIGIIIFVLKK